MTQWFPVQKKRLDKRIDGAESDILELRSKNIELFQHQGQMREQIKRMEEALAIVEPAVKKYPDSYDPAKARDYYTYDATIIRINTKKNVHHDAVWEVCRDLCQQAAVPDSDFTLRGTGVTNRFTLDLKANPDVATAARRVTKILGLLQDSDKKWKEFYITRPDRTREKLFIGRDRPLFQLILDQHTALLHQVLAEGGDSDFSYNRNAREVLHGWDVVANLEFDDDKKTSKIKWVKTKLDELQIDRELTESTFYVRAAENDKSKKRG